MPTSGAAALEVKNANYLRRFRPGTVNQVNILDIDPTNAQATVIADLSAADHIPDAQFDVFVLTQTLQFIYDWHAALHHACRICARVACLLVTVPAVSRLDRTLAEIDFWRFTPAACRRMFGEVFGQDNVTVRSYGNVLTATAFLMGMAAEDLRQEELDRPIRLFLSWSASGPSAENERKPPARPSSFAHASARRCCWIRSESVLAGDELPAEIVVVDQSRAPTRRLAHWSDASNAPYGTSTRPPPGLSRARNLASRAASCDLVVIIDDDMFVDRTWLATLVAALETEGPNAVVTGRVLPDDAANAPEGFVPALVTGTESARYRGPLPRDVLAGGHMAAYRQILEAIGGFDERLGAGSAFPGGRRQRPGVPAAAGRLRDRVRGRRSRVSPGMASEERVPHDALALRPWQRGILREASGDLAALHAGPDRDVTSAGRALGFPRRLAAMIRAVRPATWSTAWV